MISTLSVINWSSVADIIDTHLFHSSVQCRRQNIHRYNHCCCVTFSSIHARLILAVIHIWLWLLGWTGRGSLRNKCGEFRARWTRSSSGDLWTNGVRCWSFGWTNFFRENLNFMLTVFSIITPNTLAHVGANQIITCGIVYTGRGCT